MQIKPLTIDGSVCISTYLTDCRRIKRRIPDCFPLHSLQLFANPLWLRMLQTSAPLTSKEAKDTNCNQLSASLDSVNTELKSFYPGHQQYFLVAYACHVLLHLQTPCTAVNESYTNAKHRFAFLSLPHPSLARLSPSKTETSTHSNVPEQFPGEKIKLRTGIIHGKVFFRFFWGCVCEMPTVFMALSPPPYTSAVVSRGLKSCKNETEEEQPC